ncbi:unnamed protein product [Lactuca saligna]|uniref:Uncharacterized protein n=1 Tax=Lactuca saligna TaxID=75948 RepID=A0AA35VAN8_LACSI|nr:unnamed protein product [Lactuca saligna]
MDLNPHQMHTYMSASDPFSCVFATTTRNHPIHLIAQDSYVAHIEHMMPWMKQLLPSQLVSTPQEQRYLLDATDPSGYLIFIALVEISNSIQPSKETRKDNQVGVVNYKGSYSQTIAIHREDNMELLYVLHGQEGGVTHVSSILQRWELSLENNERGRGNKKRKGRDETPYDSRGSDPASWKVPQVLSIIACKTCNQVVAMFKKHGSMNQFTIHDLQISNCEVK